MPHGQIEKGLECVYILNHIHFQSSISWPALIVPSLASHFSSSFWTFTFFFCFFFSPQIPHKIEWDLNKDKCSFSLLSSSDDDTHTHARRKKSFTHSNAAKYFNGIPFEKPPKCTKGQRDKYTNLAKKRQNVSVCERRGGGLPFIRMQKGWIVQRTKLGFWYWQSVHLHIDRTEQKWITGPLELLISLFSLFIHAIWATVTAIFLLLITPVARFDFISLEK